MAGDAPWCCDGFLIKHCTRQLNRFNPYYLLCLQRELPLQVELNSDAWLRGRSAASQGAEIGSIQLLPR